jgi:hypothetical protein
MYQRLRHNPLTMFDTSSPAASTPSPLPMAASFTHPTWPRAAALHCRGLSCEGGPSNQRAHQVLLFVFGLIDDGRPSIEQSGRFYAMLCAPMQPTSSGIILVLILRPLLPLATLMHSILMWNGAFRPSSSR